MSAKKSFFDKLTGSLKVNDLEETMENFSESKIKKQEPISPTEKRTAMISSQNTTENAGQEEEQADSKENTKEHTGPLMTVTEGQLTIDVFQTPAEIVIKSTIAGVKPEDLDITITNDMVTIKGTRTRDEEIHEEDYFYQECYWGAFSRSVLLPFEIEADQANATIKNGILTLRLPKSEKMKVKKIKVKEE